MTRAGNAAGPKRAGDLANAAVSGHGPATMPQAPMSEPKPTKARAPQRSNGVRRREALLDAAAAIISEVGVAGLSLPATARRAKASIGSMYHFFADKEQLLDALRDRHFSEMAAIMSGVAAISPAEWSAMSAAEVIGTLFGRPIRYYSEHPYSLELHQYQYHEGPAVDEFRELIGTVLSYRLGKQIGPDLAAMLYAISTGTLSFILDAREASRRQLVAEIPTVLITYLEHHEAIVRK
jgi:AcrR family transcriptional regulator